MRILIACEYSGRVRDAFLAQGHDAISCDIEPTDSPGPHYQGDVMNILNDAWDMMIAFPPCTYLTNARNGWKWNPDDVQRAGDFFVSLLESNIPKVAVENPVGLMNKWTKPSQIIHPWQFGEPFMKRTCLWLKGLPPLKPSVNDKPDNVKYWVSAGGNNLSGIHRDPKERSRTFQSVALAMAGQWG